MRDLLDVLTMQGERPVAFTQGVLVVGGLADDGSFYVRQGRAGRFEPRRTVLQDLGLGFVTDPVAGTVVRICSQDRGLEFEEISLTGPPEIVRGNVAMPEADDADIVDLMLADVGQRQEPAVLIETGDGYEAIVLRTGLRIPVPAGPDGLETCVHLDLDSGTRVDVTEAPFSAPRAAITRGRDTTLVEGKVLDARSGVLLIARVTSDGGRCALLRMADGEQLWSVACHREVTSGAIVGPPEAPAALFATAESTSQGIHVVSAFGEHRTVWHDYGRVDISPGSASGTGLMLCSLARGAAFGWWDAPHESLRVTVACGLGPDPLVGPACAMRLAQAEALVWYPSGEPAAAVICLHGGPESQEFDELRYGGVYGDWLRDGTIVMAINYVGGTGAGSCARERGWGRWREHIAADVDVALDHLEGLGVGRDRAAVVGGSFGAYLAVAAASLCPGLAGVVGVAPMIDLTAHRQRAVAADAGYQAWFDARFNGGELELDVGALGAPVRLLQGAGDEVVDVGHNRRLVAMARDAGRDWSLWEQPDTGHAPDTPRDGAARYARLRAVVNELLPQAVLI